MLAPAGSGYSLPSFGMIARSASARPRTVTENSSNSSAILSGLDESSPRPPSHASPVSLKSVEQQMRLERSYDRRRTLMRSGRPTPALQLTQEEWATLKRWAGRPTTAQALAQRARIVLRAAAKLTNTHVARELRLTKQTVGKWLSRFITKRLDGLLDEPRPGAPAHGHGCRGPRWRRLCG